MFRTILVPTDGSPLSDKAAQAAIDLARRLDGFVIGFCAAEPYPHSSLADGLIAGDAALHEERSHMLAEQHVGRIKAMADIAHVPCETVVVPSVNPAEEIVEQAAKFHCDVIFMASHGRKGLDRLLLGSKTQKVLTRSTLPVVVFR